MLRVSLADWMKRHPRIRQTLGRLVSALPPSIRMGRRFWHWYAFYRESEQWSPQQIQAYQIDCLKKLLGQLKQDSPFYRQRLDGIDIEAIDSIEKFSNSVAAMTRSEFSGNLDRIRSGVARQNGLVKSQTSGTTGKALQFYHTSDDFAREWAAVCHQWSRVGYQPGKSRRAEFRGLTSQGSVVDTFPERNMIRCSILDLNTEHVRHYAQKIRDFGIDFIHGYPSALHLLAAEVHNNGIDFPQPRAVLLASEQIHDYQLESIERAFPKSQLFAHYGCAERTVLAAWCEHRREYHVLPQYALVEIDDETSEIVGTNLYNTVNGFVRYRMTDTVLRVDSTPCPDCNRPYVPRLVELGGRSEDYLYSTEKGWIPPAIITYPLKDLKVVNEIRFVQREPKKILMQYTVNEVSDKGALKAELEKITDGLFQLFGSRTEFAFEQTDNFARNAAGKFKWIVNELEESPGVQSEGSAVD